MDADEVLFPSSSTSSTASELFPGIDGAAPFSFSVTPLPDIFAPPALSPGPPVERERSERGAKKAAAAAARKRGNNNHTRRCRQKVNDKFAELLSVLPRCAGVVKHKADILDYGIARIRELSARNEDLERMLMIREGGPSPQPGRLREPGADVGAHARLGEKGLIVEGPGGTRVDEEGKA